MRFLGFEGKRLLESPVAFLEDDDVAETAGAGFDVKSDLLYVGLDFLAPGDRIAEQHGSGHLPVVREVAKLEEGIELEPVPQGGKL